MHAVSPPHPYPPARPANPPDETEILYPICMRNVRQFKKIPFSGGQYLFHGEGGIALSFVTLNLTLF